MTPLYYPPTQNGLQKSLDAALNIGVTAAMTLNNVTGVQNKPGVCLIDRIDTGGNAKSASFREFIIYQGTSGVTLTTLTRGLGGSTDQDHAVGAVVEFIPDITWGQAVIDALALLVDPTDVSIVKMTSPRVVTGINDTNGNELIKVTATASAVNEFTVANGATGNSPTITASGETNVGLDLKMKGTGKFRKPTIVGIEVVAPATDTATGDGKAFFRIPAELNGMNLTGVAGCVYTAGTTNTTDVQIRNATQTADMLTTKITIDSGETDTSTAATAAVIDTNNDDVATGDLIAVDMDAVSTTPAKGYYLEMRFELPA